MYIIEKLVKLYLQYKKKDYIPPIIENNEDKIEDIVTCKHNFMPIDSTGQILACSKCGYLVKRKRLKK